MSVEPYMHTITSKYQEEFSKIFDEILKKECYYKDAYQKHYWRDARRVGYAKAKFVWDKDMSDKEAQAFLKDLTTLEAIGVIQYCTTTTTGELEKRKEDYLFERFFKWNPFGEDIIHLASIEHYKVKDWGLARLKDMPEQKLKFLKYFDMEDKSKLDEEYDIRKNYQDNEKYLYFLHDIPEKQLTQEELDEYFGHDDDDDKEIDDTFDD